jgi:hypothetical protein
VRVRVARAAGVVAGDGRAEQRARAVAAATARAAGCLLPRHRPRAGTAHARLTPCHVSHHVYLTHTINIHAYVIEQQ